MFFKKPTTFSANFTSMTGIRLKELVKLSIQMFKFYSVNFVS